MCNDYDYFQFWNIFSSIVIPLSIALLPILEFNNRKRKDNRNLNRFIYKETLKYTFDELFKNIEWNITDDYNMENIHDFLKKIILFKGKRNKFHGKKAKRVFNKILKLADRIEDSKNNNNGLAAIGKEINIIDDYEGFYQKNKTELVLFKKEFMIFHQAIFGYI